MVLIGVVLAAPTDRTYPNNKTLVSLAHIVSFTTPFLLAPFFCQGVVRVIG